MKILKKEFGMIRKIFLVLFILWIPFSFLYPKSDAILNDPTVASKIELLETWINAQMEYKGLPGLSIGIVYDQDLIWKKGFGYRDLEEKLPVKPSTIFRIASITKLFTSTAIMQLRDAGKLRLDDPVSDFLDWFEFKQRFPEAPGITIRHLLTHTSGIPREADYPYWTDHKFPTLEQIIEKMPQQETIYPSETKWKYSNLGMAILGEVVARVSGIPYEEYIHENILEPLEMTSTSVNLSPEHKKRLAVGYSRRMEDCSRDTISFTD
ncbi:serine hydrolase, partial [candidate division KSB1 bacterium]|nr:serine hydrolase [candidate division KSB1 bacterium]